MSTTPTHGCRCGVRWWGGAVCHCSVCHLTFTGVTAFDAHRITVRNNRECVDPGSSEKFTEARPGVWGGVREFAGTRVAAHTLSEDS